MFANAKIMFVKLNGHFCSGSSWSSLRNNDGAGDVLCYFNIGLIMMTNLFNYLNIYWNWINLALSILWFGESFMVKQWVE